MSNLQDAIFLMSKETEMLDTPCIFLNSKDFKINKFLIINPSDNILDHYLKTF